MNKWSTPADGKLVKETIEALNQNGISAELVKDGEEAKKRVFELLPEGAEVMTMSSVTLDSLEISKEVQESGKYNSVKNKLNGMNRETQGVEMQKIGASPEWAVGSVQAVTKDGHLIMGSNTGSQLPAYVYGSAHVIWVVGTQKIVENTDEGIKRIYEHVLPLEGDRLNKLYNTDRGSFVSKILIINREIKPGRITLIFVPEALGF